MKCKVRFFLCFSFVIVLLVLASCHAGEPGTVSHGIPGEPERLRPFFSEQSGYIDDQTGILLSLPDGAPNGSYISYTLNGEEPSPDSERAKADRPITTETECTVVRAAVYSADGRRLGPTVTETYLRKGATSLRAVSVSLGQDCLYGEKGILSDRSLKGRESERPCSVQIIEPDGRTIVNQNAAVRLAGAGSRTFNPASFRIIARKDEANEVPGVFRVQLFGNSDLESYDSFLLRNGGNDAISQARENFLRQTGCRDAIANNICAALENRGWQLHAQQEEPVKVYVNGAFYAILNMKQDFDEDFLHRMYGCDSDRTAILKGKKNGKEMWYQIENGDEKCLSDWQDLLSYARSHALSDDYDEAYSFVASRLDIESAVHYYAVMTYLCNTDWPQNNVMVWRSSADVKWRFVIRDMDLCFGLHDAPSRTSSTTYSMADTDTFERLLTFYRGGNGYCYDESSGLYEDVMGMQGLFDFLLRSTEFRTSFKAAAEFLMSDDFADICLNEIDRYLSLVQPEISAHIDLWQSSGSVSSLYSLSDWLKGREDMKSFVSERPEYYKIYMEKALGEYD